jgi:hypothetical protein
MATVYRGVVISPFESEGLVESVAADLGKVRAELEHGLIDLVLYWQIRQAGNRFYLRTRIAEKRDNRYRFLAPWTRPRELAPAELKIYCPEAYDMLNR